MKQKSSTTIFFGSAFWLSSKARLLLQQPSSPGDPSQANAARILTRWRVPAVAATLPRQRLLRRPDARSEYSSDHHQEENRARRASWRRLESCLCRLRHGNDGAVHRALAAEFDAERERCRRRILSGSRRKWQAGG